MRLLFLFLISLNTNLFSQENKKIIDDFINEGIELWGIPGMSVVAVNDTSTLFKKSYGKRNYFSDELVNLRYGANDEKKRIVLDLKKDLIFDSRIFSILLM